MKMLRVKIVTWQLLHVFKSEAMVKISAPLSVSMDFEYRESRRPEIYTIGFLRAAAMMLDNSLPTKHVYIIRRVLDTSGFEVGSLARLSYNMKHRIWKELSFGRLMA
ncbi:hypothetical protein Mp_4g12570 [Marchantia polymorpha subsp. ruderalis]|uniref:Uncharacterized protein n=2 Tax=Marchantia polymorpha TaxID=3197 RepID=A0AAF6B982_MARPO|nr:hypothetical protein MARPO_0174s0019 [Marchantia polymorpha]BBN08566.1 hypothetical protein Mp_4g12570 [Marchantia polymorpha subsp. ruderalis]|eukprot:PTQ28092.1 hypothetical protein MARPO_0174s0019 [Marchantia polymorpha]